MTKYHFNVDGEPGHIGFCSTVDAASREEAVAIMQEILDQQEFEYPMPTGEPWDLVEYLNFYTNGKKLTVDDIDDEFDE